MKKLFIFTAAITMGFSAMAQAKNQKNKIKDKTVYDEGPKYKKNNRDDQHEYEHQKNKYSKNQPSKVRSAFNRDYPHATNVKWTKSNGYWTAAFSNGINRKYITYSANGTRVNNNHPRRLITPGIK